MGVVTQNMTARMLFSSTTTTTTSSSSSNLVWPAVDDQYRMSALTQHLTIIVVLSLLVLAGLMFTIFGLLLKAEALSRATGPCHLQDSLLFDDKHWKNLAPEKN